MREMYREQAGPPLLADFCVCTPTMDGAEEKARQYMGKFVESNFYHYELLGPHFSTVKGYDAYAQKIAMAREIGMEGIVSAFMEAAVWGTPDRILRKLEERRGIVGDFELATSFRFGGTPYYLAEAGLRLYAKEVLPVVRSWTTGG
jgi:kynureninase